jgi:proteasome-associated ATPase
VLYRGDLLSGAILASIVQRAKERAIERTIAVRTDDADTAAADGLTEDDLLVSINAEFREGEMLPPDDAAEEWLKLLDHHPEQVVGIASFRKGRAGEERPVGQMI